MVLKSKCRLYRTNNRDPTPFDSEANYVKIDGGVTRLHDFGHGIIGQLRGNYQVIPADVVPSIDQFQLGGMYTVRGYSEGLIIGRSGYLLSGELMVPIFIII